MQTSGWPACGYTHSLKRMRYWNGRRDDEAIGAQHVSDSVRPLSSGRHGHSCKHVLEDPASPKYLTTASTGVLQLLLSSFIMLRFASKFCKSGQSTVFSTRHNIRSTCKGRAKIMPLQLKQLPLSLNPAVKNPKYDI